MKEEVDFFTKNGYLVLEGFFPKQAIESVLKEAKNVFLRQFIAKKYVTPCALEDLDEAQFNSFLYRLFEEDIECLSNCGKQAQHLISLHTLSLDAKIVDLLQRMGLKTPIVSTRPVLYFNHPKLAKQKVFHTVDAHQDWRSMQGSLNAVVIWIPLVDINKALGALEILPKSHLDGLRTDHIENGFGMVALTDAEKERLIGFIRQVQALGAQHFDGKESHSFGVLNSKEWNNMFYKHLNHHLEQFGV
jgi:ectoine hydroxylase-related dioxygenase (phytanoyl-CoA dioxygenase family)